VKHRWDKHSLPTRPRTPLLQAAIRHSPFHCPLRLNLAATLRPAWTAKTEALAILCVLINCSDIVIDFQRSTAFRRLAQAGARSRFDELGPINVEVPSVIAKRFNCIRHRCARTWAIASALHFTLRAELNAFSAPLLGLVETAPCLLLHKDSKHSPAGFYQVTWYKGFAPDSESCPRVFR
jgi:hypothetical protein